MGRRALGLGEAGTLSVWPYRQDGEGKWVRADNARDAQSWWAMVYVRGQDGVRRQVIRKARTKVLAQQEAEREVERIATGGLLRASDPFVPYGTAWLLRERENAPERRWKTLELYAYAWRKVESSNLKGLTIEQANHPQRLRICLQQIADSNGPGAMKAARTVLSNVLQAAISDGIVTTNALRQIGEVKPRVKHERRKFDHDRACTREERDALLASAYAQIPTKANPKTIRKAWACADILSICFGLGTRIDEARRLRWEDVDLDGNHIYVHGTKNETSDRLVSAPEWLLERLRARALRSGQVGYVVPSPGTLDPEKKWDQSNSAGALRKVLDIAGFEWAVPHVGRRTVVTLLEKQGVPVSDISDFVGHADPNITLREYIGRDLGGPKQHLSALL